MPVSSSIPRHYKLQYKKDVPKAAGVLHKSFATVGRDCGGNCGGASLDYGHGTTFNGEWYIIPVKSGSVWALRWIATEDPWPLSLDYPAGAIPVFLWKG